MLAGLRHLLRATKTTVVLLVVACALCFNILSFAIAPLAGLTLAALQRLAIQPAVAAASELSTARSREEAAVQRAAKLKAERDAATTRSERLSGQLDDERRRRARLEVQRARGERRIESLSADLAAERRRVAAFSEELSVMEARLSSATADLSRSRARNRAAEEALENLREAPVLSKAAVNRIDGLTRRVVQRAGVNATRNLSAMPLESIPVMGPLTIITVTAFEIRDACRTSDEMQELRKLANLPDADASIVEQACAQIPKIGNSDHLTLSQCREHEEKVREDLGPEVAEPIKRRCDCLELPDGCPAEDEEPEPVRTQVLP